MSDKKMHPAMKRAQLHRKNTKEQVEELEERRREAAVLKAESVTGRKRPPAKSPAIRVNKAAQPKPKAVVKTPPKTSVTNKEVKEQKQHKPIERPKKKETRAPRESPYESSHEAVVKSKPKKVAEPEDFPEYVYVKTAKTAKQLMDEKKKNAVPKTQISPEEYERIKQARLKEDEGAQKNKKKVKADTEVKKKVVRDKETGKKKYKYIQQDPETFDEYWNEGYKPEKIEEISDMDNVATGKQIDNVIKRTGKNFAQTDKVKIDDNIKEIFTLEDLDPNKDELQYDVPIVDVDTIDTMINPAVLKKQTRDVLLIGLSESTKDAIIDMIMDSRMGRQNHVFDATVLVGDDDEAPKNCICIYSDTVPMKPPSEGHESTVEESSEDSFETHHKDRIKKVREKQQKEMDKSTKKKKVLAVPDKEHNEIAYNLKKDYPNARFIFLTKVSTTDRVDLQKLHANTAHFIDYKRFKKVFTELHRYECLVVDQSNKKRLYRIKFE